MIRIELSAHDINQAAELARNTSRKWENVRGEYGNNFHKHLIGKLGEVAVARALEEKGYAFTSDFENPLSERLCDVTINREIRTRVEIKTWTLEHWDALGRCVTPYQLPKIYSKADVVVWCVTNHPPLKSPSDLELGGIYVEIMGWNIPTEIADFAPTWTGRGICKPVLNHQVRVERMHNLDDISEIVLS